MTDTTESLVEGDIVVHVERAVGETDQHYADRVEAVVLAAGGQSVGESD